MKIDFHRLNLLKKRRHTKIFGRLFLKIGYFRRRKSFFVAIFGTSIKLGNENEISLPKSKKKGFRRLNLIKKNRLTMGDENEILSLNYKYKLHSVTKFHFRRLNLKKRLILGDKNPISSPKCKFK
jgi:hypothetical protein